MKTEEKKMMNKFIGIGRLTKDVELRFTQSQRACATFDLAISNGKDEQGNDRKADFIRCVIWEKQAENMAKYTHKGSQVAIEGSIKTDSYNDEQGNKKYRTYVLAKRIMFLDSKRSEEPLPQEPDYYARKEETDPFQQIAEINNDDMPW